MTIGVECPQCGSRLTDRGCPECGWRLVTEPGSPAYTSTCDDCHAPTRSSQLTEASPDPKHDDALPKRSRCASCHIEYLRLRAFADPLTPEGLARCKAQLADAYTRAEAKWTTKRV